MSKLWKALVGVLYNIGNNCGCHQIPERSFFYKSNQFPICARCTGVVIGQILAIITNLFWDIKFRFSILFLGIMGFDWGIQKIGLKKSTNLRRLITGILGGYGIFNTYCIIIKKIFK